MRISIRTEGFRELERRARVLDEKMRKRVYGQAVTRTATTVIVPRAKALAPVRTGALAFSIARGAYNRPREAWWSNIVSVKGGILASTHQARRSGRAAGNLYDTNETIRYYRFQELGTKYHAAQPFLLPALEQTQGESLSRMRVELHKGLERQAKALGRARGTAA